MKKSLIKLSLLLTVVCALIITTSCSSDDDSGTTPPPATDNTLVGTIDEDLTLDPTVQYTVAGEFFVTGGATLTIPAGTKIVSETGTDHYIAIDRGAKIDVQGTAANPVTMTSVNETPGDWGGLVILGDATTTAGLDVIAEVGGFVYGG